MVGSRTVTAAVVGAASLAASVGLYLYTGSLVVFFLLPFVPFLFSGRGQESETEAKTETEANAGERAVRTCPRCEFDTRNADFEYCPRDGSRLREKRPDGTDR
jgi:hypothetical protein